MIRFALSAVILSLALTMCAAPPRMDDATLTVEGTVTVRGNEPFTAVLLETNQHNSYVLVLDYNERAQFQQAVPGTFRVTGILFKDTWNGRPYAHLRVRSWEELKI